MAGLDPEALRRILLLVTTGGFTHAAAFHRRRFLRRARGPRHAASVRHPGGPSIR